MRATMVKRCPGHGCQGDGPVVRILAWCRTGVDHCCCCSIITPLRHTECHPAVRYTRNILTSIHRRSFVCRVLAQLLIIRVYVVVIDHWSSVSYHSVRSFDITTNEVLRSTYLARGSSVLRSLHRQTTVKYQYSYLVRST